MHTIYITAEDNARLRLLLLLMPYSPQARRDAAFLRDELNRAVIVGHPDERPWLIRIGSVFEFEDIRSRDAGVHTLCLPHEVVHTPNGLSVLTRFGAAVIGCLVGDEVAWTTPMGTRRILIRSVIPPPAIPRPSAATPNLETVP